MNFSRSMILVAGAAFLAACGDKVSVTSYTPPVTVAVVRSVDVAPSTATLNTGASITFTQVVNADAGVATTVTWSASAGTVTSAGVFTAPATGNPGIAVCATSTVDTGKKGCATVVVTAQAATIPATVSINSITTTGNLNGTVNPAAVAGSIDVTLNVNPGNQTVSKVELWVGGKLAGSQTFSAAQAAALRYSADQAIAAQTVFPQVVMTVNTAGCGATTPTACSATNSTPTWSNVAQAVQAKIYTGTGATASATASASVNLTFANANTYILSTVTGAPVISTTNGYAYVTGNLAETVTPVIYSTGGLSMASGTITFGAVGCDATGPRTLALTVASGVGTVTFTKASGGASAADFKSYELRTATVACPVATGEGFLVSAMDNLGNGLFTATAPANNGVNLFRVDNVAPGAPTFMGNPNGRQNGWINGSVSMAGTNSSATSNGWLVNGAADAGIGGYTKQVRLGTGTTTTNALTVAASSAPTLPAPSASNISYCVIGSAVDQLGNESTLPATATACTAAPATTYTAVAAQSMQFGVDIAAPTVAFSGGLASNAKLAASPVGAEFQVTVSDTGTVGNSGMLSGASVIGTVQIRNAAGNTCFIGAGATCTPVSFNAAPAYPLVPTTTVAASTTVGYYTYSGVAQDAAGNQSGAVTRVVLMDNVAPALSGASVSLATNYYDGGISQSFSSFANDNLDVASVNWGLQYGAVATFDYGSQTLNGFNATPLLNSNVPVSFTIPFFMRQVQVVTANAAMTVGAATKPNNVLGNLFDQAANASGVVTTAIPATSVVTGATPFPGAGAQLMDSWAVTTAAANAWDGAGANAGANPAARTLTAVAAGPTATFNAPFSSVSFYAQLAGGRWTLIGSTSSYTTTDNGAAQGRKHTFTASFTPGLIATWAANPVPVIAVGTKSTGDALISPTVTVITIVP